MEKRTGRRLPAVLLFAMGAERAGGWRGAAEKLRIRVREVSPAEYGLPLGRLAAKEPEGALAPLLAALPEPMLVMAGFSAELMDAYLRETRAAGAQPVALKAVLTPTNAAWDARRLYGELSRERDALEAAR